MFGYIPDDIVVFAYRNKWLKDHDKREIYEYAVELILFNILTFALCLIISIFTHKMLFFVTFILFFAPLRTTLGGTHLKNSYMCIICSLSAYTFIAFFADKIYFEYKLQLIAIWCFLGVISLFLKPLKDKNYNKKNANCIMLIEAVLIILSIFRNIKWTSLAIILNILVLFLFIIAKVKEKITLKLNK